MDETKRRRLLTTYAKVRPFFEEAGAGALSEAAFMEIYEQGEQLMNGIGSRRGRDVFKGNGATIQQACPLFASADITRSVAWYRDKLGFRVERDGEYGIVARDEIEVHFWPCQDRNIAENTSAYFRTDDVDAIYKQMLGAAEGGRIEEPRDREWGMREFYVWDPDGNLLRFGQPSVDTKPKGSKLDELMEQFERMSPEERARSIEHANHVLAAEHEQQTSPQ